MPTSRKRPLQRLKINKPKRKKDQKEKPVSLASRIGIILFILLALYLLAKTGGNSQGWYPGKPFDQR